MQTHSTITCRRTVDASTPQLHVEHGTITCRHTVDGYNYIQLHVEHKPQLHVDTQYNYKQTHNTIAVDIPVNGFHMLWQTYKQELRVDLQ